MGIITLYRFTDITDTINTAEKLEFNDETDLKTKNVHGFITEVRVDQVEGVGNNQGSEQNFGDKQPLGTIDKEYTITGFISARATNPNSFLDTLAKWLKEEKKNDIFQNGRFGFRDADDNTDDVIPIPDTLPSPSGLIWKSMAKVTDMKGDRSMFTLKFTFSVGDGT